MQQLRKIGIRILLGLCILIVLIGSGGYFYFQRSLPSIDGTVTVEGIDAPVDIIRDIDAVPHIYAESKQDAIWALGYVHAQDRLWQMEFQRRLTQGRLSEVLGGTTISADVHFRTVGIYRSAEATWDQLPQDTQDSINAYVDGVNTFLSTHGRSKLPPEFTLLGFSPEPWIGADVVAWSKMMAYNLGNNSFSEILRHDLIAQIGYERTIELMPGAPSDAPGILAEPAQPGQYDTLMDIHADVRQLMGVMTPHNDGLGSNNWVVDASKSTSGSPMLASDLHLGTSMPSLWYMAHLSADDFDVIGATIPGLPAVVIGRNQFIAWGTTNLDPDVQDLIIERIDDTGRFVEYQGQMEPIEIVTEIIKVRWQEDIHHQVRITRHGPLISDSIRIVEQRRPLEEQRIPTDDLALRWTALETDDNTIQAFFDINEARNWEEFTDALEHYMAPAQNFIYADIEGNIGYYGAGRIPIRANDNSLIPVEGWTGDHDWQGWIPFDELPYVYNPSNHVLATANNRPTPDDYPYMVGREWALPYRIERIHALLDEKEQLAIEDHMAMQGDTFSGWSQELLSLLLPLVYAQNDQQQQAIELLQEWDGTMHGDSPETAIFSAWSLHLPRAIVDDEIGSKLTRYYEGWSIFTGRFLPETLQDRDNEWCDVVTTPGREDCAMIAQQTLQMALDDLEQELGSDIATWRWDELHVAVFPHQPFHTFGPLGTLFSRSMPNGGGGQTLNVAPFSFRRPFEQRAVPEYRQIIDLSSTAGGYFIHPTGQSGHFLSPHYDDYLDDWQAIRYRPMRFDRTVIEQEQMAHLQLQPATSSP